MNKGLGDPTSTEDQASGRPPRLSGCDEMSTEPSYQTHITHVAPLQRKKKTEGRSPFPTNKLQRGGLLGLKHLRYSPAIHIFFDNIGIQSSWGLGEDLVFPSRKDVCLLENHHLPRGGIITCHQGVKINSARYLLT